MIMRWLYCIIYNCLGYELFLILYDAPFCRTECRQHSVLEVPSTGPSSVVSPVGHFQC